MKTEYYYNTYIISMKSYLLYWIDYFMLRGYKFHKIIEMIIKTVSDRCNMTYKRYLKQRVHMCEIKSNKNFAKNPQLIYSLDRSKNHPLIRKFSNVPFHY